MAQETKQASHLVIAAFWAHGEPEDLCRDSAEALRAVRIPGAKGSVVTFPKATVEDKTFRAVLMKLDLADVAPSLTASYVGGPRDETGGEVEGIDAIPLNGGEYRFQEIGSDLDAVFVWHPAEKRAEKYQRDRAKCKQDEADDQASGKLGVSTRVETYQATWNYYEGLAKAYEEAARLVRESASPPPPLEHSKEELEDGQKLREALEESASVCNDDDLSSAKARHKIAEIIGAALVEGCGGSGKVAVEQPEPVVAIGVPCPGCNHPDCPNRDQPKGEGR